MKLQNNLFVIVDGDADQIRIRLNADHPIYQAHFPGHPVTPGVCIIQMVAELLGRRWNTRLMLDSIVNLKFLSVLSPVETPLAEVTFQTASLADGVCKTRGVVTSGGEVRAKFSLVFNQQDNS